MLDSSVVEVCRKRGPRWQARASGLADFVRTFPPTYIPPDALVALLPWESLGRFLFLEPPPKIYAPLLLPPANTNNTARAAMPPVPRRPPQPPPQPAMDQVTAMGFDATRVREALQQTQNNVERAAVRIVTG
jgi:hypothetical protein